MAKNDPIALPAIPQGAIDMQVDLALAALSVLPGMTDKVRKMAQQGDPISVAVINNLDEKND